MAAWKRPVVMSMVTVPLAVPPVSTPVKLKVEIVSALSATGVAIATKRERERM